MRVIDAFAGIGGFSLAADALGWETVAFVERDPDCQFWLGQHWPNVPIYDDVTTVRWEDAPPCDVFTAGFPCQPHSVAGKRQASADDRDLWSECVRAIGVLRPRYAVLENVPGLLTSESGRFFNRVLSDLAALGYVGRYDVLSAAECGAPHRRERVWIVASLADAGRQQSRNAEGNAATSKRRMAGTEQSGGRGERRVSESGVALGNTPDAGIEERSRAANNGLQVVAQGRDGVGDADGERGCGGIARLKDAANARARSEGLFRRLAFAWADAIPYRGADGTVRLIPAGAVADATGGNTGQPLARGERRAERGQDHRGRGGEVLWRQEEVSRPESEVRPLVDGLPDGLAGRLAAEEVEAWATPVGQPAGSTAAAFVERKRKAVANGATMGLSLSDCHLQSIEFGGTGGSLWPVTDSEPGRVARLRAVGNAVVPAWVLAGPFQYILDRESAR